MLIEAMTNRIHLLSIAVFHRLCVGLFLFTLSAVGCSSKTDATFSALDLSGGSETNHPSDTQGVNLLRGSSKIQLDKTGVSSQNEPVVDGVMRPTPRQRSIQDRLGTLFEAPSSHWKLAPEFIEIQLPELVNPYAIWGATGRDDLGNFFLGVSCAGDWKDSATLCVVQPGENQAVSLGDSVANLRRLDLATASTMQMKIHSKPVQANDGFLYFASMDEYGEKEDGTRLPFYGSNLWRIRANVSKNIIAETEWEHLLALPEGIIATGCTGRYVYALGYYQHALYQFDTQDFGVRKVEVGSVGGHISRNLLVDLNEHVYVPRVVKGGADRYIAQLVEFDTQMVQVAAHPLEHYGATPDFSSHGIVGFAFLQNGDCIFTTHQGALYHLRPRADSASSLDSLGWFHPEGVSYAPCLYTPDGQSLVCGLANREGVFQWVVYEFANGVGEVISLSESALAILQRQGTLAYGTHTRDHQGDGMIVGWYQEEKSDEHLPYAVRVHWPSPN